MLEVLAAVDPMTLPVWAVLLFSAAMYPLGFMLGSPCSCFCAQPCRNDTCEGFDLEEAFSCRSGGLTVCTPGTLSPELLSISLASSCAGFGSGASGTVTGPNAIAGPIISASVDEKGSGYAKIGRVAPTLTITNTAAVPATATIVLTNKQDACKIDYWSVSSLSVTDGGRGYWNNDRPQKLDYTLRYSLAAGDVEEQPASVGINYAVVQPELTASAFPGSGAQFKVSMAPHPVSGYMVSSVSVSGETSGYADGDELQFDTANVQVIKGAVAKIVTVGNDGEIASISVDDGGRYADYSIASITVSDGGKFYRPDASAPPYVRPPTVTLHQQFPSKGSGAVITAAVESDPEDADFGRVTGLTIDKAGSGYLGRADIGTAFQYIGSNKFAFGKAYAVPSTSYPVYGRNRPQRGCRVSGSGIDGGVVIEASNELHSDTLTVTAQRGCCDFKICDQQGKNCYRSYELGLGPLSSFNWTTSQECQNRFNNGLAQGLNYSDYNWRSCKDCLGNDLPGLQGVTWSGERTYTGRYIVEVDQPPSGAVGCVSFCGSGGLCAGHHLALGSRPNEMEGGYGPYGSDWNAQNPYQYDYRRMCLRWLCRCYEGTGKRSQLLTPTITATALGGSGASLAVSIMQGGSGEDRFWYVTGVTVDAGGSGYPSSGNVQFYSGDNDAYEASAVFRTSRIEPTVQLSGTSDGTGALLTPTLTPSAGAWTISSVAIDDPGSGYEQGEFVAVTVTDGEYDYEAQIWVVAVDEDGGITELTISNGGGYFKSTGVIESVEVQDGGSYPSKPAFPNPSDWYTVTSNTEVGGPIVGGGSLAQRLDTAKTKPGQGYYEVPEHDTLFSDPHNWPANEGDKLCMVWLFAFYGSSSQNPDYNVCKSGRIESLPMVTEPKDVYMFRGCLRCSCQ